MKKLTLLIAMVFSMRLLISQDFTVVVLPDIQNMTWSPWDQVLYNEMQYIIDNKTSLNVQAVASLGDYTPDGYNGKQSSHSQWTIARNSANMIINAGIPYAVCIGNHDMDHVPAYEIPMPLTRFTQYFPVSDFTNKPYFGNYFRNMANNYILFSASGMDFIILSLQSFQESSYDPAVAAWANGVLDQYSNRRAIITTHMLNPGNQYMTNIITKHDNVFLAVYGHDCGDGGERNWTATTPSGKTIRCIMTDYQCETGGANPTNGAVLRWYTFKPSENKIYAKTYDTKNKVFRTGPTSQFSFDYSMVNQPCTITHRAYKGTPGVVPGKIEAENFNEGCPNVAYNDADATNQGGQYRTESVDIETCTEGGYNVGYTVTGEWLNYEVNVAKTGSYTFEFRTASQATASGAIHLEVDSKNISGVITIPVTGGWQKWSTVKVDNIPLTAGMQNIKLVIDKGDININYFNVSSADKDYFTLGVLPDIQNMSTSATEAEKVKKMTQYYIDNKTSLNVKMVSSVGDNVNGYSTDATMEAEYQRIKPAFDNLKTAGIPYTPCVGNHDGQINDQTYTLYNKYFPVSELQTQNPYFKGNLNGTANSYYLFTEAGIDYILVVIETHDQFIIADKKLDYDQASIDWANNLFTTYSTRKGIFISHDLFEASGYKLITDVVKKHDNIFMALCGHTTTRTGFNGQPGREQYWKETTVGGKTVNCLLSDYQSDADKGATVRYYTIKPLENKVYAYTYNVVSNAFETDANSQFSFEFNSQTIPAPVITSIANTPVEPKYGEAITVTAKITDNAGIASAVLSWGTTSGSLTNNITMSASGDNYSAVIPAQSAGTKVYFQIKATNNSNITTTTTENSITLNNNQCQGITIPAKIEAENYTAMSGVQTENTSDVGGGKNVGWINNGDWMEYIINVPTAGQYKVNLRAATANGPDQCELQVNGSKLGTINIDNTANWQTWATASTTITLQAGCQTIRLYAVTNEFNVNWIEFVKNDAFSKKIEAESYNNMYGVQKETCSDVGGGQNVGYIDNNDWMSYDNITIPAAGTYTVNFRVASLNGGGVVRIEKDAGATLLGTANITKTGAWQQWTTVTTSAILPAGTYSIGLKASTGGFNLNWFEITNVLAKSGDIDELPGPAISTDAFVLAYPNPVDEYLILRASNISNASASLYNLSGKLIRTVNYLQPNGETVINMQHLAKGLYVLQIRMDGKVSVRKIIKE